MNIRNASLRILGESVESKTKQKRWWTNVYTNKDKKLLDSYAENYSKINDVNNWGVLLGDDEITRVILPKTLASHSYNNIQFISLNIEKELSSKDVETFVHKLEKHILKFIDYDKSFFNFDIRFEAYPIENITSPDQKTIMVKYQYTYNMGDSNTMKYYGYRPSTPDKEVKNILKKVIDNNAKMSKLVYMSDMDKEGTNTALIEFLLLPDKEINEKEIFNFLKTFEELINKNTLAGKNKGNLTIDNINSIEVVKEKGSFGTIVL